VAQSLSNVLIHLIFSTKNREPFLDGAVEEELYKYIASACRGCGCPSHNVGGTADHLHLVCSLSRTISISKLLEEIKRTSSKWIKTHGPQYASFAWQNGYGAFSIGQSQLTTVKRYIARQKQHHQQRTFQDEFREFLRRYEIAYDERYVWD
jgi:REP element-mobilizing transposase RayT